MLSDSLPESLALGTKAALGGQDVILLGVLLTVQNLPEGFNAYREMHADARKNRKGVVLIYASMGLLGPIMALIGYYWHNIRGGPVPLSCSLPEEFYIPFLRISHRKYT